MTDSRDDTAAVAVLSAPPPPSEGELADLDAIVQWQPTRPGEYREPLTLDGESVPAALLEEADALALPAGTAFALLLEQALLIRDLRGLGVDLHTARRELCDAAAGARVACRLSSAGSAYVRALTCGRRAPKRRPRPPRALHLSVPVRLAQRLADFDPAVGVDAAQLREAVGWEVAAVLEQRTMAEWALAQLLGAARP